MTRLHATAFLESTRARATTRHALDAKRPPPKKNPIQRVKPEPIAFTTADGRVTFQVVIDKVGHGVAPDQPVLAPQPATKSKALAFSALDETEATVQGGQQRQWQHGDSIQLALVGAAVLVVALVVMAIARRQQRAYDRQHQQAAAAQATGGDLESGGATEEASTASATDEPPDGLSTPPSEDEDELSTPSSVEEGCV